MKVRCIYNRGEDLRAYEYQPLSDVQFGRFGASAHSLYNELTIGREYLVMGTIIFESYTAYLLDDDGVVTAAPCQLFEIIDNKVDPNWHFRLIDKDENIYPFVQAIFGYSELCSDKESYEKLIVDKDEEALRTYFRRKIEASE